MQQEPSEVSDKKPVITESETVLTADLAIDRASLMLRELARPVEAGEHTTPQIQRAAIRAGIEFGRARRIWYREARQILAHEYEALKSAHRKWARDRDARHQAEMAQFRLQYGDLFHDE